MLERVWTVVGRSSVVEEGTIVTAVAGSSYKVGGLGTHFASPEPLARSGHHGTLLPRRVSLRSAVKIFFFKSKDLSFETCAMCTAHARDEGLCQSRRMIVVVDGTASSPAQRRRASVAGILSSRASRADLALLLWIGGRLQMCGTIAQGCAVHAGLWREH